MEFKHGIHPDIQLLVKNGYSHEKAVKFNTTIVRKKTRKYQKQFLSYKWCVSRYNKGSFIQTDFFYNLLQLKNEFPELFYIQSKDFNKNIFVEDINILNKYGSLRIRKTKGVNNLKFFYQINKI
tara:strand:- start:201 stop:572 length:372 start_codon:yes stop_codon:yes gene_type:complete